MKRPWILVAPLLAALLGVGACAPVGVNDPLPSPAPSASGPSVTPSQPTETPAPVDPPTSDATSVPEEPPTSSPPPESEDPTDGGTPPEGAGSTDLLPGSNHNHAAAAHAHPAADVDAWVRDPTLAPGRIVFLTFDDGPNQDMTPQVLDALAAAGVPATFFVLGREIDGAPDVLRRTVTEGHSVALHSWSHDYTKLYPGRSADAERVGWEFDRSMEKVREVLGPEFDTTAWRYPGGHGSWQSMAAADAALAERGATWLDWNAMTGDAEPKQRRPTTVEAMVALATEAIAEEKPVVVMLAHDTRGKQLTVDSLPEIIEAYRAAGYEFGVIS